MDGSDKRQPQIPHASHVSRRTFLRATGITAMASGLAGILEARQAPAWAQTRRVHLLHWSDYVPAGDQELARQLAEASKALGAEVFVEHINVNDLQPRAVAAIQSGSGPDIIQMTHNLPHLYASSLVDVSELAALKEKEQGPFYELSKETCLVGGRWMALPYAILGVLVTYRTDLFAAAGERPPKTWEENRRIAKKLKAMGYPFGQTLGHTYGDAPCFSYPYLWSWGGKEVERDGKTVAINSPETIESVKFLVAMWKDGYEEGALAWDDSGNNRSYFAGEISASLNGLAIYLEAKRKGDQLKTSKGDPFVKVTDHAALPAGPAGQFSYHLPFAHAVMKYSKNQELAKDVLKWLSGKGNYGKWLAIKEGHQTASNTSWEKDPMWEKFDRPIQPYRDCAASSRGLGFAGPFNAKAGEAYTKFIVTDMYAKAVQGMRAEDAVKWAEAELRKIYG